MAVRVAEPGDTIELSLMLYMMAHEIFPDEASDDNQLYWDEIFKYMTDKEYTIFIDDKHRGFFMVKEEFEPIYPNMKRYIGTKVFIYPEYRKGKLLKEFYDILFDTFTDGDILSLIEAHSEHTRVSDKRHVHLANVYKLERS